MKEGKSFIYVSFVLRFEANLYLFSCFYLAKLDSLSLYSGCKILCGSLNLLFCAGCNDEAEFVDYVFGEASLVQHPRGDSLVCVTGFCSQYEIFSN